MCLFLRKFREEVFRDDRNQGGPLAKVSMFQVMKEERRNIWIKQKLL